MRVCAVRLACVVVVMGCLACTRASGTAGDRAVAPAEPALAPVVERRPSAKPEDALPPRDEVVPAQPSADTSTPTSAPTAPVPTPDAAALTGTWAGTYFYSLKGSAGATVGSVAFFAELTIEGDKLRGSVLEPNTIGDRSTSELRASLEGSILENGLVRFVKTYDGTGGVDHSVEYVGRLDPVTQQIEGVWKVTGSSEGRFVMRRQSRLPELALR